MTQRAIMVVVAGVSLGLAACSREPRSASYFKAHREVAERVLEDCRAGRHRGSECVNADAARIEAQAEARMALYRKAFEKRP